MQYGSVLSPCHNKVGIPFFCSCLFCTLKVEIDQNKSKFWSSDSEMRDEKLVVLECFHQKLFLFGLAQNFVH